MSANLTSNTTNVEQLDKVSIHCKWTAGPAGEFKVFARNGGKKGALNTVSETDDWYELDFGSPISIIAADSEIQIVLQETPFTEIYLAYEADTGSAADLTAMLTAKTVGS